MPGELPLPPTRRRPGGRLSETRTVGRARNRTGWGLPLGSMCIWGKRSAQKLVKVFVVPLQGFSGGWGSKEGVVGAGRCDAPLKGLLLGHACGKAFYALRGFGAPL
jgi:hypothetical protein